MEDVFNKVDTILRQEAFDLLPEFQAELKLSNRIDWAFAILFGQAGGLQVPLACDADGVLSVDEPALVSTNDGISIADYFDKTLAEVPLYSVGDGYGLAEYFDSVPAYPPLYDQTDGTPLADVMDGILAILTDVWDQPNHWLNVSPPA